MKQKIVATGLYTAVDQIDAAFRDPTLAQLQDYKLVVVLSSDYGLSSADGVGNALGDYMAMVPGAAVLVFQPNTWQTGLLAHQRLVASFCKLCPDVTERDRSNDTNQARAAF